jgi:hypothetical protein
MAARDLRVQSLLLVSALLDPTADPARVAYGTGARAVMPPPNVTPIRVDTNGHESTRATARASVGDPATRAERLQHGPIWMEAEYHPRSAVRILGNAVTVAMLPIALRFIVHVIITGTGSDLFPLRVTIAPVDGPPLFAGPTVPVQPWPLDRTCTDLPFSVTVPTLAVPTFLRTGLHTVTAWLDEREAASLPLVVRVVGD